MQSLIRSKSAGVTGGRGTAGAGPGRDLLYLYTERCGVRGHHLILFLGGCCGGVFAQRGHSADYYAVYPGSTPENHSPTEACMIHSKLGMQIRSEFNLNSPNSLRIRSQREFAPNSA